MGLDSMISKVSPKTSMILFGFKAMKKKTEKQRVRKRRPGGREGESCCLGKEKSPNGTINLCSLLEARKIRRLLGVLRQTDINQLYRKVNFFG